MTSAILLTILGKLALAVLVFSVTIAASWKLCGLLFRTDRWY